MSTATPAPTAAPLRVTRLVETNHKRISSLDISPGQRTLVILQGPNEAGKTSALEGLVVALGGKRKASEVPIRSGAEDCIIEATIGDAQGARYHIVRSFKGDRTFLSVYAIDAEGNRSKVSAGQTLLDALVSDITFNPLAFATADRPLQVRMLCSAIGQPELLAQAKARKDALAEDRRRVSGQIDALKARLNSAELADPAPGQPLHEVTPEGVKARLDAIEAANKTRRDQVTLVHGIDAQIASAAATIAELERKLAEWRKHAEHLAATRAAEQARLDAMPPETSTAELTAQLAQVDDGNRKARQQKARLAAIAQRDALQQQADALTAKLAEVDASVEQAIAASDLGRAVPGLSFRDGELYHNNLPWSQASGMRKLELSTLIGMAANPQLRIMTIDEADRLDDASLARLRELAAERQFQLWLTGVRLGDETDDDTYLARIVDGRNVLPNNGNGRAAESRSLAGATSPAAAAPVAAVPASAWAEL